LLANTRFTFWKLLDSKTFEDFPKFRKKLQSKLSNTRRENVENGKLEMKAPLLRRESIGDAK
jgi:DNA-binding MurR/RpiR family transcriptional regulator